MTTTTVPSGFHRTKERRAGFRPALLATITRDADTNVFRRTTYDWADATDPDRDPIPVEPAKFFTTQYGDESDPDDIMFLFVQDLQLDCPVVVRQEWL